VGESHVLPDRRASAASKMRALQPGSPTPPRSTVNRWDEIGRIAGEPKMLSRPDIAADVAVRPGWHQAEGRAAVRNRPTLTSRHSRRSGGSDLSCRSPSAATSSAACMPRASMEASQRPSSGPST